MDIIKFMNRIIRIIKDVIFKNFLLVYLPRRKKPINKIIVNIVVNFCEDGVILVRTAKIYSTIGIIIKIIEEMPAIFNHFIIY